MLIFKFLYLIQYATNPVQCYRLIEIPPINIKENLDRQKEILNQELNNTYGYSNFKIIDVVLLYNPANSIPLDSI